MDESKEPYWALDQLLTFLTQADRSSSPRIATQEKALQEVRFRMIEERMHALGRRCSWDGGHVVSRGVREPCVALELIDLEFVSAPDTEWFLAPLGKNPFAMPAADSAPLQSDSGTFPGVVTQVDMAFDESLGEMWRSWSGQFEGWCDLRFNAGEVRALWAGLDPTKGPQDRPQAAEPRPSAGPKPPQKRDDTIRKRLGSNENPGTTALPWKAWCGKIRVDCGLSDAGPKADDPRGFSDRAIERATRALK